jgi:polysaccharide export outer membrane protein
LSSRIRQAKSGPPSRAALLVIASSWLLPGCQHLPTDGPSARQVAEAAAPDGPYALVDLDYRVSQVVAANPPKVLTGLAGSTSQSPIDRIGPGDVLAVWIYQSDAGPVLGLQNGPAQAGRSAGTAPTSPNLTVDGAGSISVPFAGTIPVAGLTPQQASDAVRRNLVGKVIDPQVVVSVAANVANTVTVMGEARAPGKYPLSANSDRLLDMLALSGGSARPSADLEITVVRGDRSATTSLTSLLADPAENIRLAPRDQIRLTYKPRKFSTFGALAHASQVSIDDERLSLAAAISRMGGLNPTMANAASVMVFRFERPEVAAALHISTPPATAGIPVIYRLNLRDPSGYFVANTFQIRDEDLIFAPKADSVEVHSFFDLVSSITRVAYDVSVTRVLR